MDLAAVFCGGSYCCACVRVWFKWVPGILVIVWCLYGQNVDKIENSVHNPTPAVRIDTLAPRDSDRDIAQPLSDSCSQYKQFTDSTFDHGISSLNASFIDDSAIACGTRLYRTFLEVHPRHKNALIGYAQFLGWAGLYEQSYQTYRLIEKYYPLDPDVGMGLALVLSWGKKYSRSEKILREVMERYPDNVDAQVHLARINAWQGNYKKAITLANAAITRDSGNIYAWQVAADAARWDCNFDLAYTCYSKVAHCTGDSIVITDAILQLAELEWNKGFITGSLRRLESLLGQPRVRERARIKLNEKYRRLGWVVSLKALRYQELDFSDSLKAFRSGLANNSAVCSVHKGINKFVDIAASYQIGNETSENFLSVKRPVLYTVGAHQEAVGVTFTMDDAYTATITYSPCQFWRLDTATHIGFRPADSLINPVFSGASLSGNMSVPGGRLYSGLSWGPLVTQDRRTITILGTGQLSLAYLLRMPRAWYLSLTVDGQFIEDQNKKFAGTIEVSRVVSLLHASWHFLTRYMTYQDVVSNYFSYDSWLLAKTSLEWDNLFRTQLPEVGFNMQASLSVDGNVLRVVLPNRKHFAGVSASIKPGYRFTPDNVVFALASASMNTDFYTTYSVGISYEVSLHKHR